ncbi:hypothetical protein F750_0849 [Streptomyces sp. PAMC 26508]|nr:hypothetical protein F750_0849 [Streptomyces sp. PAMC 26508]
MPGGVETFEGNPGDGSLPDRSGHRAGAPRFRRDDPAVVLQNLVVDTGGPGHPGPVPPESFRPS